MADFCYGVVFIKDDFTKWFLGWLLKMTLVGKIFGISKSNNYEAFHFAKVNERMKITVCGHSDCPARVRQWTLRYYFFARYLRLFYETPSSRHSEVQHVTSINPRSEVCVRVRLQQVPPRRSAVPVEKERVRGRKSGREVPWFIAADVRDGFGEGKSVARG